MEPSSANGIFLQDTFGLKQRISYTCSLTYVAPQTVITPDPDLGAARDTSTSTSPSPKPIFLLLQKGESCQHKAAPLNPCTEPEPTAGEGAEHSFALFFHLTNGTIGFRNLSFLA